MTAENSTLYLGKITEIIESNVSKSTAGLVMPILVHLELAQALLKISLFEDERNEFHLAQYFDQEDASSYMESVHRDLFSIEGKITSSSRTPEVTIDSFDLLTQAENDAYQIVKAKTNIFEFDGIKAANIFLDFYTNLKEDGANISVIVGEANKDLKSVLNKIAFLASKGCKEITLQEIQIINSIF